jgi:GTP-binding protein
MGLGKSDMLWTAWDTRQVPASKFPRLIVVGRSNVGKSTLLNLLTHPRSHFRSGSRAGLTIGLLAVKVDLSRQKSLEIIDTPGWGYAERPVQDRDRWVALLESLRADYENHRLWVLLVDPMRKPQQEELSFLEWLESEAFALVFTKSDKLKKNQRAEAEKNWKRFSQNAAYPVLWVSAHSQEGLKDWLSLAKGAIIET